MGTVAIVTILIIAISLLITKFWLKLNQLLLYLTTNKSLAAIIFPTLRDKYDHAQVIIVLQHPAINSSNSEFEWIVTSRYHRTHRKSKKVCFNAWIIWINAKIIPFIFDQLSYHDYNIFSCDI